MTKRRNNAEDDGVSLDFLSNCRRLREKMEQEEKEADEALDFTLKTFFGFIAKFLTGASNDEKDNERK